MLMENETFSQNKGVHAHALDHCQFCPPSTQFSFNYQATNPSYPFSSMEVHGSKGSSSINSLAHFSSPNVAALLKIKLISWSQETGLHVSIRVRVGSRIFNLHKHPLTSKSGYFRRELEESNEVELPTNFPGGAETFEKIVLFIYGSSTLIDPFNVAPLRCAAEFLEMKEEYQGSANLCDRFDMYLNQVVLQKWEDTIIVLRKCQTLHPLAEELLIISRCIESLAFMACMEILDPERRREHPVIAVEALANQPWSCNCERLEQILNQELWIKDLISLPFSFFKRVIGSLRRQGMKEKFISPIIMFFACKGVLPSSVREEELEENNIENFLDDDNERSILQGIVDLLPKRENTSKVIPVGFYFSLLSRCLHLKCDIKTKLQEQIVSQLHLAQVEDFLMPSKGGDGGGSCEGTCSTECSICSSMELGAMQSIFSCYLSSHGASSPSRCSIVAELWDMYLCQIANDSQMDYRQFMNLIQIMPIPTRQTHDFLYRALNNFLLAHPNLSQEEKGQVCKYLNCQKLSEEVCVEAVQNELMPLRLIVQALFVQQLNTHQALKECSESFRYTHSGEFSGSISSSRYTNPKSQNLGQSPMPCDVDKRPELNAMCPRPHPRQPLSAFLFKDTMIPRPPLPPPESMSELSSTSKENYESTSFRIQNLEQELITLKNTLQMHNSSGNVSKKTMEPAVVSENHLHQHQSSRPYDIEGRTLSKKRNYGVGQMTNCIGSVSMSSQRKYASNILKIFRRVSFFSRGRSKRKNNCASGLRVD